VDRWMLVGFLALFALEPVFAFRKPRERSSIAE
jgi:hypothetical protein